MDLLAIVELMVDVQGWSMDDQDAYVLRGRVGTIIESGDAEVVIVEFRGLDGAAPVLASVACANLRLRDPQAPD